MDINEKNISLKRINWMVVPPAEERQAGPKVQRGELLALPPGRGLLPIRREVATIEQVGTTEGLTWAGRTLDYGRGNRQHQPRCSCH